ncbi:50S ribosomal protein L11 methyltransferase, partial [Gemmatimonadota bacterium]
MQIFPTDQSTLERSFLHIRRSPTQTQLEIASIQTLALRQLYSLIIDDIRERKSPYFEFFSLGQPVPTCAMPDRVRGLLTDLELSYSNPLLTWSLVRILEFKNSLIMTDRISYSGNEAVEGIVMPLHPENLQLANLLDISRNGRVLEIGVGSGVNALIALNRGAREVVATDINPRAIKYSLINLAFNGLESSRVTFLLNSSDSPQNIFTPVAGCHFDHIISNP